MMLGVSHEAVIAPRCVIVVAAVLRGNIPDNQKENLENKLFRQKESHKKTIYSQEP